MRIALTLAALVLALAGPAGAQQQAPVLRGPQSLDAPGPAVVAADGASAAGLPTQIQIPLRTLAETPVAGDAGQCRLTCAQSYYFCVATEGLEDCAPSWGQCRARCGVPVAGAFPG